MELYLDSADLKEIKEAFDWGILTGLTTTPTFMHRQGITDIDGAIIELAKLVPILQVEALGDTAEEIVAEAERILALGLEKEKTVFKIPASNIALKACKILKDKGMRVNIHLVYTLNQAYLAMQAGADYVCPLVGRLQDQGHDAIALIEQCVKAVNYYGYSTKVMFSSVRHAEHVRTAILAGVHTITVPWNVLKKLNENSLTAIGTAQFVEHTRLITMRVQEVISEFNPVVKTEDTVFEALHQMTESGLGAVSIVDDEGNLVGIFTDGDLRRNLAENGKALLNKKMNKFVKKQLPITIHPEALLEEAVKIFKQKSIDNIIVVKDQKPIGMLDVQDFVKMNLIG
ncbi:MAG: CBS domain-containing protein [Microscillaceae bacterium]|nr:CBS domain-containing protein [Microscillaceae bacterium]MDW8461918.1 transaldolase family protein [Cytophagales bacterium]